METGEMLRKAGRWIEAGRCDEAASLLGDAMMQASLAAKRRIVALWEGLLDRTPFAASNLGLALMRGDGVPADPERGAGLLRGVLGSGVPELVGFAHNFLGHFYAGAFGAPANLARAVAHFERAAAGGGGEAAFNAGLILEQGNGIERDVARAAANYRLGVRCGSAHSMTNLALLIMTGEVADATPEDAADLLQAAYAAGDENAGAIMMVVSADVAACGAWGQFVGAAPRRGSGPRAARSAARR